MRMVTVNAADICIGQQSNKGSSIKNLQRGLEKLRGQGSHSSTPLIANNLENALILGDLHSDKVIATAVRNAVSGVLEELEII